MLIYQLRPGKLQLQGATPPFPCEATIEGQLEPKELFAGKARSNKLSLVPAGSLGTIRYDSVTCDTRIETPGTFSPLSFDAVVQECNVSVRGDRLSVRVTCPTERRFLEAVEFVRQAIPAYLSAAVPAPVSVHTIDGVCGGVPFELTYLSKTHVPIYTADGPTISAWMASYLEDMGSVEGDALRLTSAHRYLMQVRRLAYAAPGHSLFLGERILNIAKAIEVLWPAEKHVDLMRSELKKLGVDKRVADLFASVSYLRDQIDVGHPALTTLTEQEDFDSVLRVAQLAEDALAGLLRHIARAITANRYTLPARSGGSSKRKTLDGLKLHDDFHILPYGPKGDLKPRAL
jgi:hypothetical protein